jgi:hypothetical protein
VTSSGVGVGSGQPIAEPVPGAWETQVARAERLPPSYAYELVVTGRVAGRGLAALAGPLATAAVAWLGWRLLF